MISDRRAATALEFALAAPVLMALLFGTFEYARLVWTMQALQLAGDQTARCVAISGSSCKNAIAYAVATATGYGAFGLLSGGVTIDNIPPLITNISACTPPAGNVATRVHLSLDFISVAAGLIPGINSTIVTNSCFSVTGN
jgi:Flp pilus assembly protein TadG